MATIKVLRVVAKREWFRRAGFVFGLQPQDVPLDSLTDAQREAIERDPTLLTTLVEVEAVAEDQAEDSDGRVPTYTVPAAPSSGRKRK